MCNILKYLSIGIINREVGGRDPSETRKREEESIQQKSTGN